MHDHDPAEPQPVAPPEAAKASSAPPATTTSPVTTPPERPSPERPSSEKLPPGKSPSEASEPSTAEVSLPEPKRDNGENSDPIKSVFIALVLAAIGYEVFPLPFLQGGRWEELFDNGISQVIVAVTLWCFTLLLFRLRRHRLQWRGAQAFDESHLQTIWQRGIYARNALATLGEAIEQAKQRGARRIPQLLIYHRLYHLLRYVSSAPRKESINNLLDYQSQIAIKKQESSYTLLQVCIWAIPILGFIGTVVGIGQAVSEFSTFIQGSGTSDALGSQMRGALGGVTAGLATAFNTTFLALVLVIPVMLCVSILQRNEENLLVHIEEYCLHILLPHLHISPGNVVQENFDDHLHRITQISNTWVEHLKPLVDHLSLQTEMVNQQLGGIQPMIQHFTDRLDAHPPASAGPQDGGPQDDGPRGDGSSAPPKP